MNGTDPDLAAHFTVTQAVGITLWGEEKETVFGPVPRSDYLDSIRGDSKNAEEDILRDPVYTILNLCRVLAFEKEGLILSKEGGGVWGLQNLPPVCRSPVEAALQCYRGGADFSFESALLRRFATDLLELLSAGS
ncbi:MAG: DUF4111 domain-containing protein [Oscillospiraceae bacterium]|nr:DUF4111 domain-containing protein [Oscillospiraceae bacterium]